MENFKIFRNLFEFTQDELAQKLSIEKNTIAYYESGKTVPSFKILLKTIEVFCISFDYFLLANQCQYPRNLKFLKLAKDLDNSFFSDARSNIEIAAKSLLGRDISREINLRQDNININLENNFNKNLKELRTLKKLTQPELSSKLGISRTLLSQYELKNYPPIDRFIELSNILDVSMHAISTGQKLEFNFQDKFFGETMLLADHLLSLDDQKVLIRLMESALSNKNLIYA